jgi:lysophospholipase L1-like esterase
MAQVITFAGEQLFATKAQNNQPLDIDTFIFAMVPGQDPNTPINRAETLPPAGQIVHTQIVQQYGKVNNNVVIYSTVLDSTIGPFEFNWVGLKSSVNNVLVAIQHIPTTPKTITVPGAAGNTLNRNFGIEYSGIAELAGITVDAETWQLDYTARLNGMDDLTRQLAADMNGKDWFIGEGFKVEPRSTLNSFKVNAGAGYVGGLRVEMEEDQILTLSFYPRFVYVDAWFEGTSESVWKGQSSIKVTNTELVNYVDENGKNHYVTKIALISDAEEVKDLRNISGVVRVCGSANELEILSGEYEGQAVILSSFYHSEGLGGGEFNFTKINPNLLRGAAFSCPNGWWVRKFAGVITPEMFGMNGQVEDDLAYSYMVSYAKEKGMKLIETNVNQSEQASIIKRSNVIFVGEGEFYGTNKDSGTYRRNVIPKNALPAISYPDKNMNFMCNKFSAPLKIVIAGDSLTTYGAETLTCQDGFTEMFAMKIRADNPDLEFDIVSRGVGAQKAENLDTLPNVSYPIADRYPWYTNPARAWLDYVFDENPDYVVLSFGMNDQYSFDRAAFESVVQKIKNYGAQVIIATNLVPNLSPNSDYESYGTFDSQEGRDYAAGWLRTYAMYNGYPLIDLNRTFNIVRDGRDILNTYFVEQEEIIYAEPSVFLPTVDQQCRDFFIIGMVTPEAWAYEYPMSVKLSSGLNSVVFIDDDNGFVRFKFYKGGDSALYDTVTSEIPTPSVTSKVEITVKNNNFSFRVLPGTAGYQAGVKPFTRKIIRYGGLFRPYVHYFSSGNDDIGPLLSVKFGVGKEVKHLPSGLDSEIWGIKEFGASTAAETGGNGVNHPSSLGAALVYGVHFSGQNYKLEKGVEIVENINGLCSRYFDGRQVCEVTKAAESAPTIPSGAVFTNTATAWDFPLPFLDPPYVYGKVNNLTQWLGYSTGSFVSQGFTVFDTLSDSAIPTVKLKAEGRWR